MSEFKELIKSFAKSREYIRDFFIYGFKTREDFKLIQSLLFSYELTCIPILDPTNDFEDITNYNYGNPSFRYR